VPQGSEKLSDVLGRAGALRCDEPNAKGRAVRFACGCFVEFRLAIDDESRAIGQLSLRTNGCPAMIAAAVELSERLKGRGLRELEGLEDFGQSDEVGGCAETAADALRSAFAAYRSRAVAVFIGERALICSCFGIGEDVIEAALRDPEVHSLDDLMDTTRAGTGCGSCRLLLVEMLDAREER